MIKKELFKTRNDGVKLYKTTTTKEGYYIKQLPTGILYVEAVDVENSPYTYEETDIKIEVKEEEEEEEE